MAIKHKNLLIIDAGHGGSNIGRGDIIEKELNLELQSHLLQYIINLEINKYFNVFMTRHGDYDVTLQERCDITNNFSKQYNNGLFLSIHHNWSKYKSAHGFEAHYYKYSTMGSIYADLIHTVWQNSNIYTREKKASNFKVLRGTAIPAILLEIGFMSNAEDRKKMTSRTFKDIYAVLICESLKVINKYIQGENGNGKKLFNCYGY